MMFNLQDVYSMFTVCLQYVYMFTGCAACNCNEFGSATLQCNDAGVCTCKEESGGEKCEFCSEEKKLWGLPFRPCEGELRVKVKVKFEVTHYWRNGP